ncbi:MAG TPA: SDR family oxidoreductase [Verrucomicrobiae bacterium]|nr:SDR family oxidoreductase [Verrucomicrobiae bacterium]
MILVTGATGNTGMEVVRQVTARGGRVRALVRSPEKAVTVTGGGGIETAAGDLAHPETLARALAGIEKVFLLSTGDPRQVELQGNLVVAAKKSGVKHIVKMSALGAALNSPSALARWHAQTENQIEKSGMAFTHLRPHFFMQNVLMFAPTIAKDGSMYAPMRDGRIGLVDTRDIAAVAAVALTGPGHEGKAYDITGPEALSFADLAAKVGAATGRSVKYVDVPPAAAKQAMLGMGMKEWMADNMIAIYGGFAEGHAAAVTDIVPRVTGRPGRTFDQFVKEYAHAFKAA